MILGGDYWFIVGPCEDTIDQQNVKKEKSVKVGFHRQGDIMDNEDFQLGIKDNLSREKLLQSLPHVRLVFEIEKEHAEIDPLSP